MGYEHAQEILDVLPVLDKYPIKNIAIHARIGKQLYKGGVDLDAFKNCLNTRHKIYYNGDITTVEGFRNMQEQFPEIDHWMIGRGLITDPFLPAMIKSNSTEYPADRIERFQKFIDTLFHDYASALSGKSHVLTKMTSFWEYFAHTFPNPHKTFKKIKKAKTIEAYEAAVAEIMSGGFDE